VTANSDDSKCYCTSIFSVQKIIYLGIIIDANLKCQSHIINTTGKIRLLFYKFKTLSNILSLNTMRMVFIAMAQSIYSYGIGSWSSIYTC